MESVSYYGKITVIIPMFNSENTIINALDSIKSQTAFEKIAEIIVIDDGSTDKSLEIVKNYMEANEILPIKLIKKKNGGVSSARNIGMKLAKGEYIALLDSDDRWLPQKTEIQMNTFENNPQIDFLGGNYNNKELKILTKKIDKLYHASVKDLCIKFFPVTPSAIFKKSIIESIGYFDESQEYAEDGNYFIKICNRYNYYHLPEQVVICGEGKPEYGYSGLSSNLKGMYNGNVKNIKELKNSKIITYKFYVFLRVFYYLKYIRRIILTRLRKIN